MNPIAIAHLAVAAIVIVTAVPLIRRRVKMNHWYGVRFRASFASDEAWYDINHYGGRLLLYWGLVIAATAVVGTLLERRDWIAYDRVALVIVVGGLGLVVAKVYWYASKRPKS